MPAAIEVAVGVYRFPTFGDYINTIAFLEDDGSVTLVDCGTKRAAAHIVKGLRALGKSPADVNRIVLTHAHFDHAGAAAEMVRQTDADGVITHHDDAGYVRSGQAPPRDPSLLSGRVMQRVFPGNFEPVPVVGQVSDGDVLDIAGGVSIHHTPGHTPGHISIRHERSGVLVTGDAIFNMNSRMSWPFSSACSDHKLNEVSAHVLGELDYDVVAFTHGPHISVGAREAVRGFLRRKDAW